MVRWVASLLVFGGLLASSAMAIAQVEDGRVKILLERITGDGPWAERRHAERELERLGEDAVFGLMLIAIENPDDDDRSQAMEALERVVSDHPEWRLPRLVVARIDYSTDREYVSEEFGEDAEEFILANVDHSLPQIRRNALYLLSFLELPDTKVMPVFRQGIQDSDPKVRAAAAVGLIRSGEKTPKAIEALVHRVGTEDLNDLIEETIRESERYFHEPLVQRVIDPKSTDQVYHDSLDLIEGYHGADALGAAFNPLREALNSENRTVQLRAAMALAKLWYDAPSVANILADEIENAGPMRDAVWDAIEESHLYPPRIEKIILDLTRSDDPALVRKGLHLAANAGLVERHAGELATHLLEPTRLRTTVNVLGRRSRSLPYKPEYIAPLESLVRTESLDSRAAIHVLLNMEKPGIEAAMGILHDPELTDWFRAILLQELQSRMRHLRKGDPLHEFLDRVAELLDHENLEVACRAAMALQMSDYSAKSLTPVLLKGYASNAHPLSRDCHTALYNRGKADQEAVPTLLAMLEDADADRRNGILMLLNRHGGDSDREVNLLVEYLVSDVDGSARSQIAWKIRQPVAERLASLVDQGPTEIRLRAMVALRAALEHSRGSNRSEWKEVEGKTPPPGVIDALSAEDEELRFAATMLLLNYQPQAEEALPVLRKVIACDAMGSKWEALQALESYGPAAAPLLPELLADLRSEEIESTHGFGRPNYHLARRKMVLGLLSRMGTAAAPAVPDLIELLDDAEIGGRRLVTWGYSVPDVLASIGEAAKPAEPILIEMLPEAESLTPIAKALKGMGGSTDKLIAEIDRRLDDPVLCYQAVTDLQVISDIEPVTPRLMKILKSDNLLLKRDVADMLASRNLVRDPVLVPLLKELLQEESVSIRESAVRALAEHDIPVQVLIERLKEDESIDVRQAVLESLEIYAGRLLRNYRPYAARTSRAEIERSVQRGELPELSAIAAIPALEELLRLPDELSTYAEHLRIEAAYALAKFGESAQRSLPLLLELHGQSSCMGEGERLELSSRSEEMWENALLTAIWSIDVETAIEDELPRPKPRRDW